MQGYYLSVNDKEIKSRAGVVKTFFSEVDGVVVKYKDHIRTLLDTAIMSGELHDALEVYLEYVTELETMIAEMGEKYVFLTDSFIDKIDDIDDYLYDMKTSEKTRNFSQQQYEELLQCLDDPWCEITDNLGDLIYSAQVKVANFFDWKKQKKKLNDSHQILLDYNDETAAGLKSKFDLVHDVDKEYGKDSEDNHFGYYGLIMDRISKLLSIMGQLMENSKNGLTSSYIEKSLSGPFKKLKTAFDTSVDVWKNDADITVEQITSFADWLFATTVFIDFTFVATAYVQDVGVLDAAGMVVFNAFDIVDDVIVQKATNGSCRSYQDYLIKKQLLSNLDDMVEEGYAGRAGSAGKELTDKWKTVIEYIKDYGDEWYDKLYGKDSTLGLDKNSQEAKEFKTFLEGLGGAKKILSYGKDAIDYVTRLFTDYESGLEIIDSLERNIGNDETVKTAIADIRALYKKEFDAWAQETIEGITEIVYKEGKSALLKANPVGTVIKSIDKGIDLAGKLTGAGTKLQARYEALQLFNLQVASGEAYSAAVEKLRVADPELSTYEQLANDVKNCFQLHKKNMENMFAKMSESESGEMKSYYKYCEQQVSTLSMLSLEQPELMTFEEFQSLL